MRKGLLSVFFLVICNVLTLQSAVNIDSLKEVIHSASSPNPLMCYTVAVSYKNAGDYSSALSYLFKAKNGDQKVLTAAVLLSLNEEFADVYLNLKNNDSALYYINISDSIYTANLDKPVVIEFDHPYNLKSIIYRRMGDYSRATEAGLKALEISVKEKNFALCAVSCNSIGILQEKLFDYKKAGEYYLKGIDYVSKDTMYPKDVHDNLLGNLYMNLGNAHKGVLKFGDALICYNRSKDYFSLLKNEHRISNVYNNISSLEIELKEYDSAVYYARKSLSLKEHLNVTTGVITNYQNLSKAYRYLKKPKLALKYSQKEIVLLKDPELDMNDRLNSLLGLSKTYEMNNLYSKSLFYLKQHNKLKDSILDIDEKKEIANLEAKYETQQKENEILTLTNKDIRSQANLAQSRILIIAILGLFLLALTAGLYYRGRRQQQHKLALLANSVKASEQEKSRIGKELHDNIASSLIRIVHDNESTSMKLSHDLLGTYNEVRGLSHQLNNMPQHDELFMDRVLDIIPLDKEDKKFEVRISPIKLKLTEPYGTHIFRIMQELIANNLKHSKSIKSTLKLDLEDEKLTFEYADNGQVVHDLQKGSGLKNMEDRVTLMNGELKLDTDDGFRAFFTIPYKA